MSDQRGTIRSNQYDGVQHQPAAVWWQSSFSKEMGASLGVVLPRLKVTKQDTGEGALITLVGCFKGHSLLYSLW